MAFQDFRIIYERADFLALSGQIPLKLVTALLLQLPLASPIKDIKLIGPAANPALSVEWETLVSDDDVDLVDDFIATFIGGATTSEPFEIESLDPSLDGSGALVPKIDFTTPLLDEGTYQVSWACEIQPETGVPNTGVLGQFTVTRSDGASRTWRDTWDLPFPRFFGSCITFKVSTGQTIRTQLSFQKLGVDPVNAAMSVARVTIDQIAAGNE